MKNGLASIWGEELVQEFPDGLRKGDVRWRVKGNERLAALKYLITELEAELQRFENYNKVVAKSRAFESWEHRRNYIQERYTEVFGRDPQKQIVIDNAKITRRLLLEISKEVEARD